MTLQSAVLTYRVLESANLSSEKQQPARATTAELTYENMKKELKVIHDSSPLNSSNGFDIKLESAYLAERKIVILWRKV